VEKREEASCKIRWFKVQGSQIISSLFFGPLLRPFHSWINRVDQVPNTTIPFFFFFTLWLRSGQWSKVLGVEQASWKPDSEKY
jgi:hypothetical protein